MIRSFANAFRGIWLLMRSERNFQIHLIALICVVIAGSYFEITWPEWALIVTLSTVVMGLEALNTSIEKLCDVVTEERKESIRNIKDIAAGSVLIAAIASAIVALLIFYPYIKQMTN